MADDIQKKYKALVERRHPCYEEQLPHWDFLHDCYEGGRGWFADHIFRYIKEGDKEYKDRVIRAYRFNHSREIVDLVNKYIFKMEISRKEDADDIILAFWESATKNNLDITQFMRQVSQESSTYGRIWVIVDNNVSTNTVLSRADEKQAEIKIYAYIVPPQQVLDYSFDEEGKLNWILLHEIARDDEDPLTSSGNRLDRFRLWTRTEWLVLEERIKGNKKIYVEIDRGINSLGEVPAIPVDNTITDELYNAPSLIGDIAYLDRAVANYLSNLDAIIQDQTFSQLAMPAQGVLPGESGYEKLLEMGTKRLFTYDGEGGAEPHYLSPDVKQAQLIMDVIHKIINEIYHTVGMAGERTKQDNSMGIDNSSGVAKAYDFERVNALLASKADSLELAENRINEMVGNWAGIEIKEELVEYPDNFDVRGLYDEFDIAERLALLEAPDTIRREQMKAVEKKLFPTIKQDLKKKMDKEIDSSWPPKIEPLPGAGPGAKPKKKAA